MYVDRLEKDLAIVFWKYTQQIQDRCCSKLFVQKIAHTESSNLL